MIYQVTMANGKKYIIPEEEVKDIILRNKKKGLFFFPSLQSLLNLSFIASIVAGDRAKLPYQLGDPSQITKENLLKNKSIKQLLQKSPNDPNV